MGAGVREVAARDSGEAGPLVPEALAVGSSGAGVRAQARAEAKRRRVRASR